MTNDELDPDAWMDDGQERDCEECGAPGAIAVMESSLPTVPNGPYLCMTCVAGLGPWFTDALRASGNAPTHAAKRKEQRKAQRKARKRARR